MDEPANWPLKRRANLGFWLLFRKSWKTSSRPWKGPSLLPKGDIWWLATHFSCGLRNLVYLFHPPTPQNKRHKILFYWVRFQTPQPWKEAPNLLNSSNFPVITSCIHMLTVFHCVKSMLDSNHPTFKYFQRILKCCLLVKRSHVEIPLCHFVSCYSHIQVAASHFQNWFKHISTLT